ncbi:hypothetical protein CN233_08970, partial [Sinorhizobium meliloti]
MLRIPSLTREVFESAACPFAPRAGRRCRQADEGHFAPMTRRQRRDPTIAVRASRHPWRIPA